MKHPTICHYVFLVVFSLACLATTVPASGNNGARPNIVFIMIDDLGWMDLACQGNQLVETPNIDRFAKQGIRFTNAYAAAPVCSPTRASILTGISPAELKITNHTPDRASFTPENSQLQPAKMLNHLPAEHTTIAEHLKQAGYKTGFIGKWHLSGPGRGEPEFEPTAQGFDLNIAGCGFGGPPTFFDPYRIPHLENRKQGEYLPDRLTDESIKFIRQHQSSPFMLFLWNYTVHWPMEAPDALLKKYETRTGPGLNDTRYGAMIEAMDRSIGKLLDEIDRLKLTDNTLVVFTSDNGGFDGVADNRPLRKAKGYLYEGGIRVPLMMRWPKKVKPNQLCQTPVISMDHFPTLLDVAGIEISQQPRHRVATSLLPLLTQEKSLERDAIYFHYPNFAWHRSNRLGSAVRSGKYKLIERFDDNSVELYDLDSDLSETNDLSQTLPKIADKLKRKLHAWRKATNAELPSPRT